MFHVPNKYRVTTGNLASDDSYGNNGFFRFKVMGTWCRCIVSDGGWEHVSVSLEPKRMPTWEEMCAIKDLFWDEDDVVVQYHPAKADYVNNHSRCLHLWRTEDMPTPPSWMVGDKSLGTIR
jgi:hypothetical protein